jgi:hypothetical protein
MQKSAQFFFAMQLKKLHSVNPIVLVPLSHRLGCLPGGTFVARLYLHYHIPCSCIILSFAWPKPSSCCLRGNAEALPIMPRPPVIHGGAVIDNGAASFLTVPTPTDE